MPPTVGGVLRPEFLDQPKAPPEGADDPEVFNRWNESLIPGTRLEEKLYLVGFEDPDQRQDVLDLADLKLVEIAREHNPDLAETFARGLLHRIKERKGGTI